MKERKIERKGGERRNGRWQSHKIMPQKNFKFQKERNLVRRTKQKATREK